MHAAPRLSLSLSFTGFVCPLLSLPPLHGLLSISLSLPPDGLLCPLAPYHVLSLPRPLLLLVLPAFPDHLRLRLAPPSSSLRAPLPFPPPSLLLLLPVASWLLKAVTELPHDAPRRLSRPLPLPLALPLQHLLALLPDNLAPSLSPSLVYLAVIQAALLLTFFFLL